MQAGFRLRQRLGRELATLISASAAGTRYVDETRRRSVHLTCAGPSRRRRTTLASPTDIAATKNPPPASIAVPPGTLTPASRHHMTKVTETTVGASARPIMDLSLMATAYWQSPSLYEGERFAADDGRSGSPSQARKPDWSP